MVKVRLVEASVNSKVGRVMVVKVMSQSSVAGTSFATARIVWPKMPILVPEMEPSTAVARADDAETVELEREQEPVKVALSFPSKGGSMAAVPNRSHIG